MHIEDQGKIWIIRSIVGGLAMMSEKNKPRGLRRYINIKFLTAE